MKYLQYMQDTFPAFSPTNSQMSHFHLISPILPIQYLSSPSVQSNIYYLLLCPTLPCPIIYLVLLSQTLILSTPHSITSPQLTPCKRHHASWRSPLSYTPSRYHDCAMCNIVRRIFSVPLPRNIRAVTLSSRRKASVLSSSSAVFHNQSRKVVGGEEL